TAVYLRCAGARNTHDAGGITLLISLPSPDHQDPAGQSSSLSTHLCVRHDPRRHEPARAHAADGSRGYPDNLDLCDAKIASVWEQELVARLLEAVDRSSAKGKRDYAILLLACRLGMRVGDIRTLKLDQIHWEDSTIKVTQSKTVCH